MGYNMYEDSLMKCHYRFLITIYISVGHEKIMNFKYSIVLSFVNLSMVNSIHYIFFSQFISKQTYLTALAISVYMF